MTSLVLHSNLPWKDARAAYHHSNMIEIIIIKKIVAPFHVYSPLILVCSSIYFFIIYFIYFVTLWVLSICYVVYLCAWFFSLSLLFFSTEHFFYWTPSDCAFIVHRRFSLSTSSHKKKSIFLFIKYSKLYFVIFFHLLLTFFFLHCVINHAHVGCKMAADDRFNAMLFL